MKQPQFAAVGASRAILIACAMVVFLVAGAPEIRAGQKTGAKTDPLADARIQFEQAVRMRTMLEGLLPQDRSVDNYQQTIAAYHKVYLISPQAEEVTPALIAEAELYEEMGRQYDEVYFNSAVESYKFLLKQYPNSRYRSQALYSIGKIQREDMKDADKAEATFKEFLKRFPKSDRASDAKAELEEIAADRQAAVEEAKREAAEKAEAERRAAEREAAAREGAAREAAAREAAARASAKALEGPPLPKGDVVEPRVADNRVPWVRSIQATNGDDTARVIVTFDDTVKFDTARIPSPERMYFDIYKARISTVLVHRDIPLGNGLLKSARIAQNREGVVRLVLDAGGTRNVSAVLLAKPYRLVIDIRSQAAVTAAKNVTDADADRTGTTASSATGDPPAASAKVTETAAASTREPTTATATKATKGATKSKTAERKTAALAPPPVPAKPNRDGGRSLTRELGLKISRIVIDPGHGGHDTGTIGPHGLMEKDLCLDVALKLGYLIEQKIPGAEVVYTRRDDTFVPLEERTAIANNAKADLFISIHANSSHDHAARGVETYYLNFATSQEAMDVATRENAAAQSSMHDLQDLIKKIARNDKIEESKELASDIQDSLAHRMQLVSQNERNRGVKKAPFVVLIGANMPSVLAEISFISNPLDERLLKRPDQRQKVADGVYRGIAAYLDSLNSLAYNRQRLISDNRTGSAASNGNPK
jgi:N-acetylmuramoyl-L-alanine amidase